MNGIHDMGGIHGLGPIAPEQNEPVFHAPWEGRVFALLQATLAWGRWPGDAVRQEIERMPAADYLRARYYEKWLFSITETTVTRNIHPLKHTRLPRFARGKPGVIIALLGAHVFPDMSAVFQGENAQPLYTVKFQARTLWGEAANPRDTVCLDLWEDYLDPA